MRSVWVLKVMWRLEWACRMRPVTTADLLTSYNFVYQTNHTQETPRLGTSDKQGGSDKPKTSAPLVGMWSCIQLDLNAETNTLPDGPAVIILSLLCANIRNCMLYSSKTRCLDMLLALSRYLTDEAKVDRLVPYILEMTRDESPIVRANALLSLRRIVSLLVLILFIRVAF